jgi:hypothetical protein
LPLDGLRASLIVAGRCRPPSVRRSRQPGVDIAREEAAGHIFGYTIFNDVSARDAQATEMEGQLGPGEGNSDVLDPEQSPVA